MIVSINSPAGADYWISRLNTWLQAELFRTWEIDPNVPAEADTFIFYPRVYRNRTADGFTAELYTAGGNYKEVYYDDTLAGCAWFGLSGKTLHDQGSDLVDIHLVAWGNLKRLYPQTAHRADNEFRLSFENLFRAPLLGFTLVSTEIGLPNVLREYPGSRRDDRLIGADMGEVHAFRLNLRLLFNPAESCPNPSY